MAAICALMTMSCSSCGDDADQAKHDASVKAFHKSTNLLGPENGMVPMVWDINACNRGGAKGIMTILDRANLKVFCEPAMEGIKEGVWSGRFGVILPSPLP